MTEGGTVRIRIGDRDYDKPYLPSCTACTSPVLLQIDTLLSYGWTYGRVREYMISMRPAGIRPCTTGALHAHVAHLAAPHAEARRQLEEDVTARGGTMESGSIPVTPADLARLTLQRAYAGLASGGEDVPIRDAVAILKLQRDFERDETARQLAGTVEQWQAALREVLWIARKHLGPRWADFAADLRGSETLTAIMPPRREVSDDDSTETADRAVRP